MHVPHVLQTAALLVHAQAHVTCCVLQAHVTCCRHVLRVAGTCYVLQALLRVAGTCYVLQARFDVSALSAADLLKLDYKPASAGGYKVGVAAIFISLPEFTQRCESTGGLAATMRAFAEQMGAAACYPVISPCYPVITPEWMGAGACYLVITPCWSPPCSPGAPPRPLRGAQRHRL